MSTRSGRTYKPSTMDSQLPLTTSDPATPTESDATPPTATPIATAQSQGELGNILELMRGMLQDRAMERRHYEEENEKRINAMTKHMQLLEKMMTERSESDEKKDNDHVKLTRLSDSDDIESYLTTFERMMAAYNIDNSKWAYKLAPQLTGKAQQAYAALDPTEAQSYVSVKAAILRRYNINEETYRKRFRTLKLKQGQTPTEIATRPTDLAGKWLKNCHSANEVRDAVVKEQLMTTLPEDVRIWVTERKPKTTTEAAQLAEDYIQAHSSGYVLS